MAKIVLSLDGEIVDQRALGASRVLLGRDRGCDLVIDSPQVSQRHAIITTMVPDHFIEDLGSTNGTVVNGQRIERHLLQNGDVVFLGDYRLKVPECRLGRAWFRSHPVARSGSGAGPGGATVAGGRRARRWPARRRSWRGHDWQEAALRAGRRTAWRASRWRSNGCCCRCTMVSAASR